MAAMKEEEESKSPSTPIVIDNGSGFIKAGFAKEEKPSSIFQSIIGFPADKEKGTLIGQDCSDYKGNIDVHFPIMHGVVTNWNEMEALWNYTFKKQLKVASENHPIFLTEAPLNPRTNREKTTQIMFEKFNAPSMYLAVTAQLALYASGRTTGLVLDIGDHVSFTVPISEGFVLNHAVNRLGIAGREITAYLFKLLNERGEYDFESAKDHHLVRRIKETHASISENPLSAHDIRGDGIDGISAESREKMSEISYSLPDGKSIQIGPERVQCGEILFEPMLIGKKADGGINWMIDDSIKKCDLNVRNEMYGNILLSGGGSMINGLETRLFYELAKTAPKDAKVKMHTDEGMGVSGWKGGAILAGLDSFSDKWITREEYDESGTNIIHRKGN